MPRPTSKTELLAASEQQYNKLLRLIASYSKEQLQKEFPQGTLNRNIRDVLAHLHHWHLLLVEWYTIGMKGEKPDMPAKGYTWKTLPDLNRKIWAEYQTMNLETAKGLFVSSHAKVHQLIYDRTEQELFEKKRYLWTGSTSLAAYLISNTSSHYNWAIKLIKKGLK